MIRTWPLQDDGRQLRSEVEAAGDRFVRLGPAATAADLHTELARALELPSYYGHNLDALHDVLRDVDAATVVLWPGWRGLAEEEPQVFGPAVRLLGERLVVLLPGATPGELDQLDQPA